MLNRRRAIIGAQSVDGGGGGDTENFVRINSPIIENKILTTGSSGLVRTPEIFAPGSSTWKIRCGFTMFGQSGYQDFCGSVSSAGVSQRGILVESSSNNLRVYLSSNGSSWDILSAGISMYVLANTPYVYEVEFTGTQYRSRISSDGGETFGSWVTVNKTTPTIGNYYLGFGLSRNGYLNGEINLEQCAVWIDDVLWWTAYV